MKRSIPDKERAEPSDSADVVPMPHIRLDDAGVAWIEHTNVKVIEIVLDQHAHGWSPEEIHRQHPHLSMAQIHAALAWYDDHQAELDADIKRRLRDVEEQTNRAADSPLRRRIRSRQGPGRASSVTEHLDPLLQAGPGCANTAMPPRRQ